MATATRNATKYTFTVLVTAVVTYIITVSFTGQRLLVKRKISIDISTTGNFGRQQNETSTKLDGHENQNILRQIEAVKSVCVHKEDPPTIPHSNSSVAQNVPIRGSVKRRVLTQRANRTPTQEILSRRRRVEKVCQTTWVRGEVHGVFTHRSGVIYCYVPKAGCTFWKRVFTAVQLEMDMLINYHFERIKEIEVYMFYRSCITLRELAYRLWQTFQWKGYIDPEMTYIVPDDTLAESAIKNDLIAQVRRARESGLGKADLMLSARERFQAQVYQTLPKYLFENLMIKYKTDFQLFGYEDTRDSMYSSLYNSDLTQTHTNLNSNQKNS